ncbi:hypothetical protein CRG98_034583 [Punica granatum]|uniref:Uncharacterized protein n=1 Tax=Punica granatum TaxID=22663 RepID=A0A2I0ILY4_PUNGR|nr:hypothetical protein CRG98_034583 [Punica granatum]
MIRLLVKLTSLGWKDFVMRIVGTMMRLKHTSSEVGFVKRELMHKILEACMFRVDQSYKRRSRGVHINNESACLMKSAIARDTGACPASCGVHERLLGEFAICTSALPCGLRGALLNGNVLG